MWKKKRKAKLWNFVFWTWHCWFKYQLTAAVDAYKGLVQDQVSKNSQHKWGKGPREPTNSWGAIDSWWLLMEENTLSLGLWLLVGCPLDDPIPICTWSTITGNNVNNNNNNQRGMKLGVRQAGMFWLTLEGNSRNAKIIIYCIYAWHFQINK